MLYKDIKLDNIKIKGNIFLAPLAGYTDVNFRYICKRLGASLTYSEMISLEGLSRDNKKTQELLKRASNEDIFAIQVFASNEEIVKRSIDKILEHRPILIDLNCGCPVTKVVKTGAGSALMKDLKTLGKIVKELKEQSNIPITVKMRLGWDEANINYIEAAKTALDNGASAITLHTRTRAQGYSGKARIEHLENLRKNIKAPLFASGDIFSIQDMKKALEFSDAIMLARGAINNPWLFHEGLAFLKDNKIIETALNEKINILLDHLDLSISEYGQLKGSLIMRKFFINAFKNIENSNRIKKELALSKSKDEYLSVLKGCENLNLNFVNAKLKEEVS